MTLSPEPELLTILCWTTLLAVIVSLASAVLKKGFKQFDLFGVIMFTARILAVHYELCLPKFHFKT
jgi:uncharacterized membrane protein YeiH